MKKEKVVGVRLTQEQYDMLEWGRVNHYNPSPETKTMSAFIGMLVNDELELVKLAFERDRKKAEAKAKREAKKAANDTK